MKLEIYPEECCEVCGETIHNHFNCPVCKTRFASTDQYGSFYEEVAPITFSCEECHTKFKLLSGYVLSCDSEWEIVVDNNKQMK